MSKNFVFIITVVLSLSQLVVALDGETKKQLITGDDFTNLSEIRVRTIGFPVETKCKLYQAELRKILGDEHSDSVILFAMAIDYLMQKDSPIRNPQSVINDMVKCQTTTTLQQLDTSPQQRDNQCEARIEALRRELEETKQLIADSGRSKHDDVKSEAIERLQDELRTKQALLNEASEFLKQKDLELEKVKQMATSEQSELSKKLEESRLGAENKLQTELREKQMLLDQVSESLRQKNLELEEEKTKHLAASEKYESIKELYEKEIAGAETLRTLLEDKQKQLDESNDSLRRKDLELVETRQSAAREQSELNMRIEEERLRASNRTQAESQANQALLDEANNSLKKKKLELDELKVALDNVRQELNQREQVRADNDRKEADDRAREQEEQKRKEEDQRRKKEEEQELVTYTEQAKLLRDAMANDNNIQTRCSKYLLLFNETGKITKERVEAVANLEFCELIRKLNSINMMSFQNLKATIYQQYDAEDSNNRQVFNDIEGCRYAGRPYGC